MRVLVVEHNGPVYKSILEQLKTENIENRLVTPPYGSQEEYLSGLMKNLGEFKADAVISFEYYSFVSLACEAMGIRYICYLIDKMDDSLFDTTILREWNDLYTLNSDIHRLISGLGKNISFIPFIFPKSALDKNDSQKDVLVIADNIEDQKPVSVYMEELLDSSKGYIDGMLESYKSNLTRECIYDGFAGYIKEDIEKNYPMDKNDMESIGMKYDRLFLRKIIDSAYPVPCIHFLLAPWNTYNVYVYTRQESSIKLKSKRLELYSNESSDKPKPQEYKITICFPKYEEAGVFSKEFVDLIDNEVFFMVPLYTDLSLYENCSIITFKSKRDLEEKVHNYLCDSDLRKEAVEKNKIWLNSCRQKKSFVEEIKGLWN